MRSARARVGFGLGIVCAALGLGAGCSSDETTRKGQLMVVLKTDMNVPKDVSAVRIEVLAGGVVRHRETYPLGPDAADLKLPGTLAIIAGDNPSLPVKIRVIAYRGASPQVLKETITTVPTDRIASLPMSIHWLCWDDQLPELPAPEGQVEPDTETTCQPGETCSAGTCVASEIDSSTLEDFDAKQVYGGGSGPGALGTCFDTLACFDDAFLVPVELSSCSIETPALDPGSTNVGLVLAPGTQGICNGDTCIIALDSQPAEGWSSDAQSGRLMLPAAVCDEILDGNVLGIAVTGECTTKTPAVPTCGPWSSVTSQPGTFDAGAAFDAPDPCFATAGNDGDHCGSDLGGGDPSTLYSCAGGVTVDTQPCPGGCAAGACVGTDGGGQDAPVDAPSFKLGAACTTPAECGAGLDCVLPSSAAIGGEGPAGGLCTVECTTNIGVCSSFGGPGVCTFVGTTAWCLPACTTGGAGGKCHGRSDLACGPVTDAASGGQVTACRPTCGTDQDCGAAGSKCNLASGLCASNLQPGTAPIGAACSGSATCVSGACLPLDEPDGGGATQACSGLCVIGAPTGCGATPGPVDGGSKNPACLLAASPGGGDGDLGYCASLCDDLCGCSNPNFLCKMFNDSSKEQKYGALGYCAPYWEVGGPGC